MESNSTSNLLVEAGLAFEVEKQPHYVRQFSNSGESFTESKMSCGIFRTDTGDEIGDVGKAYEVAQTAEVLRPFLEASKAGYLDYKSGRAIDNGRRFSLTFNTGDDVIIHGEKVQKRVIVGSSHDGSWSTFIKTYVYRLICSNGLMGFGLNDCYRVRHTENWKNRYNEVLQALQRTEEFYRLALQRYENLFDIPCPLVVQKSLTDTLLDIKPGDKISTRKQNQRLDILRLAVSGKGIRGNSEILGTAAAWYNAVAEYIDNHTHRTSNGNGEEKRFVSANFGAGEARKKKAFELVSAL